MFESKEFVCTRPVVWHILASLSLVFFLKGPFRHILAIAFSNIIFTLPTCSHVSSNMPLPIVLSHFAEELCRVLGVQITNMHPLCAMISCSSPAHIERLLDHLRVGACEDVSLGLGALVLNDELPRLREYSAGEGGSVVFMRGGEHFFGLVISETAGGDVRIATSEGACL